jgi:hypothetical protein
MIKNLIVFFSISGALVLIYNIMNRGLGKRWDELGLVLFVIILFSTSFNVKFIRSFTLLSFLKLS